MQINLVLYVTCVLIEKAKTRPVRGPGLQKSTSERDWGLAGLRASPGWFSKSPKPGASAMRLDFDLKGRDPTARSEGPGFASGKSLVQA